MSVRSLTIALLVAAPCATLAAQTNTTHHNYVKSGAVVTTQNESGVTIPNPDCPWNERRRGQPAGSDVSRESTCTTSGDMDGTHFADPNDPGTPVTYSPGTATITAGGAVASGHANAYSSILGTLSEGTYANTSSTARWISYLTVPNATALGGFYITLNRDAALSSTFDQAIADCGCAAGYSIAHFSYAAYAYYVDPITGEYNSNDFSAVFVGQEDFNTDKDPNSPTFLACSAYGCSANSVFVDASVLNTNGVFAFEFISYLDVEAGWDGTGEGAFDVSGHQDLSASFEAAAIPTPEPASVMLLATGLAGIGAMARRRKAA